MFINERILITGTSGLAQAFYKLVQDNNKVILAGRAEGKPSWMGDEHHYIRCDLNQLKHDTPALDLPFIPTVLILNAGVGFFKPFLESDISNALEEIQVNINANLHLLHHHLPLMLKSAKQNQTKVKILAIGSHAAFIRVPRFAVYAATKTFMDAFLRSLTLELQKDPVDICIFHPGAIATAFASRSGLPAKMLSTPKSPEEVAHYGLENFSHGATLFSSMQDRLLYLLNKLVPPRILDTTIASLQQFILQKRLKEKS